MCVLLQRRHTGASTVVPRAVWNRAYHSLMFVREKHHLYRKRGWKHGIPSHSRNRINCHRAIEYSERGDNTPPVNI